MRGGILTVQGLAGEPHVVDTVERGHTIVIRAKWGLLELCDQQEDRYVISDIMLAGNSTWMKEAAEVSTQMSIVMLTVFAVLM